MHFEELRIGEYRVYAGALEGPRGDGYIAAVIVQRGHGGSAREILRDESLACGHRWPSAEAALGYAITRGQEAIRKESVSFA